MSDELDREHAAIREHEEFVRKQALTTRPMVPEDEVEAACQRLLRLTLGLLAESVEDQLLTQDVGCGGDTRLRCDMCGVVLTYWRADGGTHERPHNDGCLIPKWEALLEEARYGA